MRIARLAALAALVLVAAAVAGIGHPEPAESATDTPDGSVTVTGLGAVSTTPDRAEVSFGVETRGATARAALAASSAEMRKVVAALRAAGLGSADLKTQQVSVSARSTGEGGEIAGFTAVNAVAARIRDVARVAAVIDAAVAAGANQVFGPTFGRSNAAALYRDALRSAYADARAKAEALAAAAGLSLGRATALVEGGAGGQPVPLAEAARDADVPVEPGAEEVQASVTVTFATR